MPRLTHVTVANWTANNVLWLIVLGLLALRPAVAGGNDTAISKANLYIEIAKDSERAALSWERYISWVDVKKGPTGQERYFSYGLYDVLGNYTEYVLDWYVQKYDPETAEGDLNDPAGPNEGYSDGIRPYRALKGFDYLNYTSTSGQNNVHIGGRLSLGHDQQSNRYGFRVCCPAE